MTGNQDADLTTPEGAAPPSEAATSDPPHPDDDAAPPEPPEHPTQNADVPPGITSSTSDDAAPKHPTQNADVAPGDAITSSTSEGAGGGGPGLYGRLIADLEAAGARYRLIDHPPEGRTELVSAMRGHDVAQAAKCLIVMVKIGKKRTRHVLAVVPGDARLDLQAVKALLEGTYATFAGRAKAEELAGSVSGTVLPFSYHAGLEVIADPALLRPPELYFNAARLDRSIALATDDYVRLAAPRIALITA